MDGWIDTEIDMNQLETLGSQLEGMRAREWWYRLQSKSEGLQRTRNAGDRRRPLCQLEQWSRRVHRFLPPLHCSIGLQWIEWCPPVLGGQSVLPSLLIWMLISSRNAFLTHSEIIFSKISRHLMISWLSHKIKQHFNPKE